MSKKPSLRKAIDGKCFECIYDEKSGLGTWRQQVEKCTIESCSLWAVRPISAPKKRETSGKVPEALAKYAAEQKAAKTGE